MLFKKGDITEKWAWHGSRGTPQEILLAKDGRCYTEQIASFNLLRGHSQIGIRDALAFV